MTTPRQTQTSFSQAFHPDSLNSADRTSMAQLLTEDSTVNIISMELQENRRKCSSMLMADL
jgi:hypothetical protein